VNSDIDLAQTYRRLLSGWLWIIGAATLGGLLGLLAASVRLPMYEASAVVGIGIDRNRADVPDDVTVRQAFDRVRGLLLADDTVEAVIALASERSGGETSVASPRALREQLRLSERPDGWVLAVRSTDPLEAESLAQAWAEVAVGQLEVASIHAARAAAWQQTLYEAHCELLPAVSPPGSARWVCRSAAPVVDPDTIPESILAEVEASRGILPVLTYPLLRGSSGTSRAVAWERGSLVLGGALLGLATGCMAVAFWRRPLPEV